MNVRVGMPTVEVVTPEGCKQLWAAALPHNKAVAAVQGAMPPGCITRPSNQRLPVGPLMEGFRYGEVRRVA
jgi:hypothetical protein